MLSPHPSKILSVSGQVIAGWFILTTLGAMPAQAQVRYDSLKCYRVTDPADLIVDQDVLALQADYGMENCRITRGAKLMCVPASANLTGYRERSSLGLSPIAMVGPEYRGARTCYRLRCPALPVSDRVVSDMMGTRMLSRFIVQYLCPPAVEGDFAGLTTTTLPGGNDLVINEIDFADPTSGNLEFVEIFNPTHRTISLSRLSLVFVAGVHGKEYRRVDLDRGGVLAPGDYLVVGSSPLLPRADIIIAPDTISNEPTGAVVLVDTPSQRVLDTVSYGTPVTNGRMAGFVNITSLVETTELVDADDDTETKSLIRFPSGADTNDNSIDWTTSLTPTPGSANVP